MDWTEEGLFMGLRVGRMMGCLWVWGWILGRWEGGSDIKGGSEFGIRPQGGSEWRSVEARLVIVNSQLDLWSSGSYVWFSLSLSLSLFVEFIWSENRTVKWFPGQRLVFFSQLKCKSGKCYFLEQPNTLFYGKWFPEMVWSQNKRSLSPASFKNWSKRLEESLIINL